MANKSVFASMKGRLLPAASAKNLAGAPAYAYDDAHALAQVAMTGTFGQTFYQDPMQELSRTLELAGKPDPVSARLWACCGQWQDAADVRADHAIWPNGSEIAWLRAKAVGGQLAE